MLSSRGSSRPRGSTLLHRQVDSSPRGDLSVCMSVAVPPVFVHYTFRFPARLRGRCRDPSGPCCSQRCPGARLCHSRTGSRSLLGRPSMCSLAPWPPLPPALALSPRPPFLGSPSTGAVRLLLFAPLAHLHARKAPSCRTVA